MPTIAQLLCQSMIDQGIDHLYCLPGVQNDDFFNALVDFPALQPIATRHEQAVSYMATGGSAGLRQTSGILHGSGSGCVECCCRAFNGFCDFGARPGIGRSEQTRIHREDARSIA